MSFVLSYLHMNNLSNDIIHCQKACRWCAIFHYSQCCNLSIWDCRKVNPPSKKSISENHGHSDQMHYLYLEHIALTTRSLLHWSSMYIYIYVYMYVYIYIYILKLTRKFNFFKRKCYNYSGTFIYLKERIEKKK